MKREPKTKGTLSRRTILGGMGGAGGALMLPQLGLRRASAQSERYGGMLRVSTNTHFSTLNPVKHLSSPEFVATKWMYSNLTRLDHERKVQPDLAESWEAGDEAKTWTFTLREGVKFHSGREVTADDVAATFGVVLNPDYASPYRGELGPIDKVEAIGKHKVKFSLRNSYADLPVTLSVISGRIIAGEGLGDMDALASREYGSGPFKLAEFVPGDRIVFERFGEYFKKGLPYVEGASLKTYPEAAIEMNALKKHETDLMIEAAPEFYGQLSTSDGIDALNVTGGTFPAVVVPCDKPPFNDNRVREALKYTADRNLILAGVYNAFGEIGNDHPISTAFPFHVPTEARERNIEKAKALLKEAGYGDGLSFTLYVAVSPPMREKLAVILKEMARPAGIDIKIEIVSYDRFLSQIWNKAVPYVVYYNTRPTTDAILMKLYHPTEGLDEGRWASEHAQAIKLLERARVTVDFEERKRLYGEFYPVARDNGAFVITFFRDELGAKGNYVMDYHLNPNGYEVDIENAWLTADAPMKKA